jgi:hypothetical protein
MPRKGDGRAKPLKTSRQLTKYYALRSNIWSEARSLGPGVMVMLIVPMMIMMMRVMMQLTGPRHARILAEHQGFNSDGHRV